MIFLYAALLLCILAWTVFAKKLTPVAAVAAGILAVAIYWGTGIKGIALLGTFFLIGIAVTAWRKKDKIAAGFAETESSRRNAGQVWANGAAAGALGLCAALLPQHGSLFLMMMAGAFSAAAADTCASELGVLYGKSFYNTRTWQKDRNGLDGVVSVEGSLCGVAGSSVIAGVYYGTGGGLAHLLPIIVAGTVGNFVDSWLGATLERKGVLKNNGVNLINTLSGAAVAGLWWQAKKKSMLTAALFQNYLGDYFFDCCVRTGTNWGFL